MPRRYWFMQRTSGYGSTPNTWQGWLFTLVFLAAAFAVIFGFDHIFPGREWIKVLALLALGIPGVWVIWAKTEP